MRGRPDISAADLIQPTRRALPLAPLNAALDAALGVRVAAHQAREERAIGVQTYLDLLRLVRRVEDVLEPARRRPGVTSSRAYELCTTDEQLSLEVAA